MNKLPAFFRLLRWPNLLIILITQIVYRYAVLIPWYHSHGMEPGLLHADFFLLVGGSLFVAGAGYAINDYFDLKIDQMNKPDRVVLGRLLDRRTAIITHNILNALALGLSVILGIRSGFYWLPLIFATGQIALWFYSLKLKGSMLWGNILISLMVASVIGIVWLTESMASLHAAGHFEIDQRPLIMLSAYGLFSFLANMVREIIKDIEDLPGDAASGCRTLPIVRGIHAARKTALGFGFLLLLLVGYIAVRMLAEPAPVFAAYSLLFLMIPIAVLLVLGIKASERRHYRRMQILVKFIMVAGIVSMFLWP